MKSTIIAFAAALLAPAAGFAHDSTSTERYEALLEQAPSIVTLRMVVKIEMSFQGRSQDRESRDEVFGVVVSDQGMIMCGYDAFRSIDTEGMMMKRTPTEIKVVFESEEKEYDAELVATDQKINMAFVKIKDLEGRETRPISFADAPKGAVGDTVHQVVRLDKGFDYAPYVRGATISGKLRKPRKALLIDGPLREVGLPVFNADGQVSGALTRLESGMSSDASPFGAPGVFAIIDGKIIARLIEQAEKQAAELAAEEAEEEESGE